jgi:hypothetical protein
MYNTLIELYDELIEERLLRVLSAKDVLPYQDLKMRAALIADDRVVRRVLNGLIAQDLVQRRADRKGIWYLGYVKAQAAERATGLDDVPAPFAKLLSQLAW